MIDDVDHLLATLHFEGDSNLIFAVAHDAPTEVKKRMFAAMKSYYAEQRFGTAESIDKILEQSGDAWRFDRESRTKLQVLVDDMVFSAREEVNSVMAAVVAIPASERRGTIGRFVAGSALYRLQSSFTAAALMARFGYGFEAAAVERLILEQMAWAYSIRGTDDLSLLRTDTTRAISSVKGMLPWAGHLYGWLSERTHLRPALTTEYIRLVDAESDLRRHEVLMRRPERWSAPLGWCFVLLADGFRILTEVLFQDVLVPRCITVREGSVAVRSDRPLKRVLDHYCRFAPERNWPVQ